MSGVDRQSLIEEAAALLKRGGLVVFPTETVYGLGADANNLDALNKLFMAKKRPINHPVIVHIENLDFLDYWVKEMPNYAKELINKFWPGPLTLILPRSEYVNNLVTGGQDTVGIRMPKHEIALKLINEFHNLGGKGVVAPSANMFGNVSPTDFVSAKNALIDSLEKVDLFIDGGECDIGIESTIVDCSNSRPQILRKGAITGDMISKFIEIDTSYQKRIRAPGGLASHYRPRVPVVTNIEAKKGDGLIALSEVFTPDGVTRLASPSSTREYAQILYRAFRQGDILGVTRIVVMLPNGDGLAAAIRDRVLRASFKEY